MNTIKHSGMVLIGLVLIWLAGGRHTPLLEMRKTLQPGLVEPLEQTTPLVAFTTVALGGFRGIIADALWLRAGRLQEEGKYFELVQLADWITKLEPRFPEIWAYQAWNMTYNISVLFVTPEDRWRWVYHGIQLLRDQGLKYNPNEAALYWELGWFFLHKIGEDSDSAHAYYKQEWSREMSLFMDGLRPDYQRMRQVPQDRSTLVREPGMSELMEGLRKHQFPPFRPRWLSEDYPRPEVQRILKQFPEASRQLVPFLQRRQLQEEYKLDLDAMERLEEKFAPLDWRNAYTHAIYWAHRGLDHARGFDRTRLHRMRYNTFRQLFDRGRMIKSSDQSLVGFAADLSMLEPSLAAYEEAIRDQAGDRALIESQRGFMLYAMGVLYRHQEMEQVQTLFERLRRQYPSPEWDGGVDALIHQYLVKQGQPQLTPNEAIPRIMNELRDHYIWSRFDETRRAAGHLDMAERIYRELQNTMPDIPDFDTLRQTAAAQAQRVLSRQHVMR